MLWENDRQGTRGHAKAPKARPQGSLGGESVALWVTGKWGYFFKTLNKPYYSSSSDAATPSLPADIDTMLARIANVCM